MPSPLIVRRCSIAEIGESGLLPELVQAYAAESRIPELGEVSAQIETYRAMEASGAMFPIGAFGPRLVGVATLLVYGLPHYAGRRVATMESFFVLPAARRTGAGLKLLHAAEQLAGELGATAFLVTAPVGGRLARVLPRSGYRETNRIFIRSLQ